MPHDGEEYNSMQLWRARTPGIDRASGDPTKAEAEHYVDSGKTATDAASKIDSNPEVADSAGIDLSDGNTKLTVDEDTNGRTDLDDVKAEKNIDTKTGTTKVEADLDVDRSDGSGKNAFSTTVEKVKKTSTQDKSGGSSTTSSNKDKSVGQSSTTSKSPSPTTDDPKPDEDDDPDRDPKPDKTEADERTVINVDRPNVTGGSTNSGSSKSAPSGLGNLDMKTVLIGVGVVVVAVISGGGS